jgi:thiamine-monophosphate kinase
VAEGQKLAEMGVKAAIDISDGLASDLEHICQCSRVGARVEVEKIPVAPVVRANFGERALALAVGGGEDYELLFTASNEVMDEVMKALSCPVTVIGEVVAEGPGNVVMVDARGRPVRVAKGGWEHFRA